MAFSGYWESPLLLVDYLLRILRVVILLSLWRVVLSGRGEVSGMTLGAVLTYTLIAEVFAQQLDVTTRIEESMWEGTLTGRFLQPLGLVGNFTAELLGSWAVSFATFSIPLLILGPFMGVDPRPVTPLIGVLFAVSLTIAVAVGLAVDFIFCGIAGAMQQNIWVVKYIRTGLATLLSGALLPLQLLPWGLGNAFAWLPFASMASAPLRIYTATGDPVFLIALQLFWCAALWPVANWIWTVNRERLAFHGG
ncbi:MAG: ABC-2 family transporter protein [Chloroflexota bacterium]